MRDLRGLILGLALAGLGGCGGGGGSAPRGVVDPPPPPPPPPPVGAPALHLRRAVGALPITRPATTPTYQAYFHIPIAFEDQAPFLVALESPELIDYRFVRISPPNVLVAARLRSKPTTLRWEAWVVVKQNDGPPVPTGVPLTALSRIPDEVRPWLQPSDCVQWQVPLALERAKAVLGSATDLRTLSDAVVRACGRIKYGFDRLPYAFDAYYTFNWGNSCTGHAHAGAALLRANGVPSRILLNMPSWEGVNKYDQHWIAQYYVPGFGWARMETTLGQDLVPAKDELVTLACAPEDEFPLFFPEGIEGYWHTSDPAIPVTEPNWVQAHIAYPVGSYAVTADQAQRAVEAAARVFGVEVDRRGAISSDADQRLLGAAAESQAKALARLTARDVSGFVEALQQAATTYEQVRLGPPLTRLSEGFEGDAAGWTHGGSKDSWRLGRPAAGGRPGRAHLGQSCFGTGFDGGYPKGSDSWLLSPPFDLREVSRATLSFWLYNWVSSPSQGRIADPLWVELTTDGGQTFHPICSQMGGVNQDPDIPAVGGWSRMHLDLTPFAGADRAQIRFRFRATSTLSLPGSYLDDVEVQCRP